MAIYLLLFITVIIGNQLLTINQANAFEIIGKTPILQSLLGYVIGSMKDIPKQLLNPPENTNVSLQYLLYTPDHPQTPCYLEPSPDALKRCPFDPSYPMKFLVHGFLSTVHPGGPFMMIKDKMLKVYQYNVILVDWSPYSQPPYMQAAINTLSVGCELANLIQFLLKSAGVDAKNIHLIGHSLGAHISGVSGEKIPHLGRITGLDPAAKLFVPHTFLHRLIHSDAEFVDVIHSSNHIQGFGEEEPLGDLDFYPNGGNSQPQCQKESKNAGIIGDVVSAVTSAVEYVLTSFVSIFREIINPPRNMNSSIQYVLYTPDNPRTPCYLEQNKEALERCPFNSSYPLKFLTHGFLTKSPPLWEIKDRLLANYICNVIIVDWTRYNQPPYWLAAINTQLVGHELANFIQFFEDNTGLDPASVHLIGHSLGAHVSGVAGKETPNLWRISGLDPAAPLFSSQSLLHRLTDTDADFVDVIHTSASTIGFGIEEPIGDQDFYPNGGTEQPQCINNSNPLDPLNGPDSVDFDTCDHSAATVFYLESVNPKECVFLSAMCDSYEDFQAGKCSNRSTTLLAKMGYTAQPVLGLEPMTKFYLRTGPDPPYCLEDGYEPE